MSGMFGHQVFGWRAAFGASFADSGSGAVTVSGSAEESYQSGTVFPEPIIIGGAPRLVLPRAGRIVLPVLYVDGGRGVVSLSGSAVEEFSVESTREAAIAAAGRAVELRIARSFAWAALAVVGAAEDAHIASRRRQACVSASGEARDVVCHWAERRIRVAAAGRAAEETIADDLFRAAAHVSGIGGSERDATDKRAARLATRGDAAETWETFMVDLDREFTRMLADAELAAFAADAADAVDAALVT